MSLRTSIQRVSLAIVLLAAARPKLAAGQLATPDSGAMDRIVMALVDSGFSGVVLVARGDSLVLRRAYSRRGPGLTPESAFSIASMTKGFTAVAILHLVQDGRLSLADSLGGLLRDVPADKRGITIEQLLTHSAGLAGEYSGGGIADRAEAVRAILAPPLVYPPGHGYRYGDDDYELLAALIETITHQSWIRYVQEQVLDPVGLTETGFWCGSGAVPLPVPRVDGTTSRCSSKDRGTSVDDWGHRGANGMSSTVADLFRWVRALDSSSPIAPELRRSMAEPRVLARREEGFDIYSGYGLRIYVRDGRVTERWHSGSGDDGHTAIARVMANGITIIVLSNAGWRGETPWASYVALRIYPH